MKILDGSLLFEEQYKEDQKHQKNSKAEKGPPHFLVY